LVPGFKPVKRREKHKRMRKGKKEEEILALAQPPAFLNDR